MELSDTIFLIDFGLLGLSFVVVYSFFVAANVAIRKSSPSRLDELVEQGTFLAPFAKRIVEDEDSYLLKSQLGQLISAFSFGLLFLKFTPDSFKSGWILLGLTIILAITIFTIVQIVKGYVGQNPEKILCNFSLPIIAVYKLFSPITWIIDTISRKVINTFRLSEVKERSLIKSVEDISQIVEYSSEAGEIDDEEREMIQGVFEFSETIVQEIMTPRADVVYVTEQHSLGDIVKVFKSSAYSRLLVCGADLDDVKGVLLAKDLIPFVGTDITRFHLPDLIRPAYFCPFNKKVDDLLQDLRANAVHLAVVLDEHGGVDGVITLEDLVEEIVGDIVDEFDVKEEEDRVRVSDNGDLLVDGGMSVSDLNRDYNLRIPEGQYSTFAGFIVHKLGRLPNKGEVVSHHEVAIKIEKVIYNRIKLLRVIRGDKPLNRLVLVKDQNPESKSGRIESKEWSRNSKKEAS